MFRKKKEKVELVEKKSQGLWRKCEKCEQIIYNQEWEQRYRVCPNCNYHFRLTAMERIQLLIDPMTFEEQDREIYPVDALSFKYLDTTYKEKLKEAQEKTGQNDGIIIGKGNIYEYPIEIGVMDFEFLGGSMGSVVGEKIKKAVFYAIKYKIPLVLVATSGGARMQEGMLSLMQMAKTSAAVAKLEQYKLPFIMILTNPTTGGVSASFAMLGDIIMAEPGALVGFAGPRVIEQTIKQKLPAGFQSSEFQLEHGFVDMIVERKNLKQTLFNILDYLYDW
ncbi:MAG TPA: acetyl-CoA carboxylase carboxyl transferase subunit beta [Spirochaetia bacterium]|nr:MAG: acetyl-CoA carboxylase subunit beta [Spirochaetes bacterium GWB1_36_13]HCL55393.1 acetyl-CoA carboxylase carboxyl transferase subunit beta [Spirochaetia bacterium]